MSSFSSLPGLKYGTFFGGTSTLSPVFGLRPLRGSRRRRRKLPNPRSSIFSPRCSASMMLLNTVSTITSECFLVRSDTRDTSSTSSAFVMLPFVIRAPSVGFCLVLPGSTGFYRVPEWNLGEPCRTLENFVEPKAASVLMLEVISQRHFRSSRRFRIRFPIGAELVVLQRANAQSDFAFGGNQLDDLHLIAIAHLQIELLVLARVLRVVELRNVNQTFDAFGEFHERAEVGQADDLPFDDIADVVLLEQLIPHIGLQLLQAE